MKITLKKRWIDSTPGPSPLIKTKVKTSKSLLDHRAFISEDSLQDALQGAWLPLYGLWKRIWEIEKFQSVQCLEGSDLRALGRLG